MDRQMPEELIKEMEKLNNHNWDKVEQAWLKGESEKADYRKNYPVQKAHLVEGNRRTGENKTIPTPDEKDLAVRQQVMQHAKDLKLEEDTKKERNCCRK